MLSIDLLLTSVWTRIADNEGPKASAGIFSRGITRFRAEKASELSPGIVLHVSHGFSLLIHMISAVASTSILFDLQ